MTIRLACTDDCDGPVSFEQFLLNTIASAIYHPRIMSTRTPQVDAYIEKAQPFARPILNKIRTLFHRGCPQLEEKLKWSHPSFEYKGMLGGMAAFKQHVSWGFWKAALLKDPHGVMKSDASSPMGGGSPRALSELPSDRIILDF